MNTEHNDSLSPFFFPFLCFVVFSDAVDAVNDIPTTDSDSDSDVFQ